MFDKTGPGQRTHRSAPAARYTPVTTDTQLCNGCIELEDYVAGRSALQVWRDVSIGLITDAANPVGDWWCFADGPTARYSWTVSGDTRTLEPIGGQDACHQRGTVWSGTWARV